MENERKRTKHLFHPYRTPRDNCHSCDSCGVASSGSEFGAGERTDDRLCRTAESARRLADPVLLRFRRLLHSRIAGIQQTEGGRLHQEVFRCLLQLGSAYQLFHKPATAVIPTTPTPNTGCAAGWKALSTPESRAGNRDPLSCITPPPAIWRSSFTPIG